MLKNVKAVLFDLDGSLVDSMWLWREIDIAYLGKFGIPLPENLQADIEGMSFSETAEYFKKRFSIKDDVEVIKNDWNQMAWEYYTNHVPLKKGAGVFLQYCRENGIRMGIATSNSRALVSQIVEVHGLSGYFDGIVTGCEVMRGKPAPDIYLEAARKCNAEPASCLVFEDIIPGILAGKAAGMKVCAVADEYSREQEEEKIRIADFFIRDYEELMMRVTGRVSSQGEN